MHLTTVDNLFQPNCPETGPRLDVTCTPLLFRPLVLFLASPLAGYASPQGFYITSYYRHCTLAFSLLTHVFFMYDTVMNLMRVVHSMLRVQPMEPR